MAANPKTELFETMAVERIERAQMINKGGKRGIVLSDLRKIISCILKGIVVVSAAIGVILSALASAGTFMGGRRVFMYFTIQSNIAIGLIMAWEGDIPSEGTAARRNQNA